MASQQSGSATHSAEVIGNAFVEQYYHILHHSPELVYRFYQDSSVLGRPDPDGVMTSVTTTQGINDKIMSLDYHNFKAEIKTVDSQDSLNGGVVVVVTGSLLGKENSSSNKFIQSFFLAPQDKGYYVLNDILRTMEEVEETFDNDSTLANGVYETSLEAPLTPEKDVTEIKDQDVPESGTPPSEELNNIEEVKNTVEETIVVSNRDESSVIELIEKIDSVGETTDAAPNELQPRVELSTSVQEEPIKMSYASIVKAKKENTGVTPVIVPATSRSARPSTEQQSVASVPIPPSELLPPSNDNSEDKGRVDGCSVYIRNLPMNATEVHLEDEFKKFGSIKPGGIQVRSSKQQGFCYGFVEFETPTAVQEAIEQVDVPRKTSLPSLDASPITIGGRQCFVEVKKTTSTARGDGRGGRFPAGRGGFRGDGPRGRGNFSGRGYGRGEVGIGRGWGGGSGWGGDSSQRADQNGNGRNRHAAVASNV